MKAVIILVGLACIVQVYTGRTRIMDMISYAQQRKTRAVETHEIRNEIQRKYADLFQSSATKTEVQNVCKEICQRNQQGNECEICKWLVFAPLSFRKTAEKRSEANDESGHEEKYISFSDAKSSGEEERGHKEVNMNFDHAGSSRRAQLSSAGRNERKKTYLSLGNTNTRTTEAVDAGWGLQGGSQISFGGAGSSDEGTVLHFGQQQAQMANTDASAAQHRARRQEIQKQRRSKLDDKP